MVSYLGMEKGCFVIRDRNGETERYPMFENEIAEGQIKSGNSLFRCLGLFRLLGNRPQGTSAYLDPNIHDTLKPRRGA